MKNSVFKWKNTHLFPQEVAELDPLDGKVDNGRVLLHEEGVLGEPLDVQDDEPEIRRT